MYATWIHQQCRHRDSRDTYNSFSSKTEIRPFGLRAAKCMLLNILLLLIFFLCIRDLIISRYYASTCACVCVGCAHVRLFTRVCVRLCACACVCKPVRTFARSYVCLHGCVCTYTRVRTFASVQACTHPGT